MQVNSSFKFHPNTLKLGQERVYRILNSLRVYISNSVKRLWNYDPEKGTGHARSQRGVRVSVLSITALERGRGSYMKLASEYLLQNSPKHPKTWSGENELSLQQNEGINYKFG